VAGKGKGTGGAAVPPFPPLPLWRERHPRSHDEESGLVKSARLARLRPVNWVLLYVMR